MTTFGLQPNFNWERILHFIIVSDTYMYTCSLHACNFGINFELIPIKFGFFMNFLKWLEVPCTVTYAWLT